VLQAVKELGYQSNVTARCLRTRHTQLLAIMVPDLTNPFYPQLIRGAQASAEQQDYQILVYDSNDSRTQRVNDKSNPFDRWIL
jgi:LacI family transcriptional regulator